MAVQFTTKTQNDSYIGNSSNTWQRQVYEVEYTILYLNDSYMNGRQGDF